MDYCYCFSNVFVPPTPSPPLITHTHTSDASRGFQVRVRTSHQFLRTGRTSSDRGENVTSLIILFTFPGSLRLTSSRSLISLGSPAHPSARPPPCQSVAAATAAAAGHTLDAGSYRFPSSRDRPFVFRTRSLPSAVDVFASRVFSPSRVVRAHRGASTAPFSRPTLDGGGCCSGDYDDDDGDDVRTPLRRR